VLNWTAGSYLVITLILLLLRWPGIYAHLSVWTDLLVDSSQLSINARSTGFLFESISALPQSITFVLILVMIIGASPGGTAGGVKVTTIAELTRGTKETLAGRPAGRPFGVAIIWLLVYLVILTTSTIGLLIEEPGIQLNRSLFLAASALGNVGLSHDRVDASTAGLYILSATMMLGRVAPVMMLWYVVDTTPEATVAVA
jgi:trk system potassium uptake protein TrkH